MPEGDTIFRVAAALRPYLLGQRIVRARAGARFPRIERLAGSSVEAIEPRGKHLIVRFDNGLALHTHLRMTGSWHRYAPGERWRKPPRLASVVLEVPESVVVCFSAPIVELMDERGVERHRSLATLGPDLLAPEFDAGEALRRLRSPERAEMTLGEALLDQRALAGVGNIFKSEVLFVERLDPWIRVAEVSDDVLQRVVATAERLLRQNVAPGQELRVTTDGSQLARGARHWAYGRENRPCFRCRTRILARPQGEQQRITFWCPRCQGAGPVRESPRR